MKTPEGAACDNCGCPVQAITPLEADGSLRCGTCRRNFAIRAKPEAPPTAADEKKSEGATPPAPPLRTEDGNPRVVTHVDAGDFPVDRETAAGDT